LLVFLAYLGQMFEPLNQLTSVGATISSANASIRRVFEILDSPDEVKDAPDARSVSDIRRSRRVPNTVSVHGNISYEDVSFSYDGTRPALQRIKFTIRAGESAAIIGPSGAGKTTMLNLIPRFFDPGSGAVLLEGIDLRVLRVKDLRSQIALVLQEPIILPTTVAENISYGKINATMSEIEAAAKAANAHDFIRKLPLQYGTPLFC
jgi:ATP-binding cassette subfamily B protein/subfamily B ATP-binding cassette protein MsbA